MGCIYAVRNLNNGKYYIGKTTETMKKRKSVHEALAKRDFPKTAFHRALKKYELESFSWRVIVEESDVELLNRFEIYTIIFLDSRVPKGYNITQGGDGASGFVRSVQDRERKSEAAKRQWQSEELRRRAGERTKRWWKNPENREKIEKIKRVNSEIAQGRVPWMKGRKHTEETKAKMRLARSKYRHVHDCSGRFTSRIVRLDEKK